MRWRSECIADALLRSLANNHAGLRMVVQDIRQTNKIEIEIAIKYPYSERIKDRSINHKKEQMKTNFRRFDIKVAVLL